MARPTMSKTIYLQQLGRGMRLAKDKEYLMVFDFIDNANLFNMPYSLHRMFNIKEWWMFNRKQFLDILEKEIYKKRSRKQYFIKSF